VDHKAEVITRIERIKHELKTETPNFKGKAALVKKLSKHISFLTIHKTNKNLEGLILQDADIPYSLKDCLELGLREFR